MKLSLRLLFSYFLIVGVMAFFLTNFVFTEVKPLVRQSVEETLVDSANMLAEIVAAGSGAGEVRVTPSLRRALTDFSQRKPDAGIWSLYKNRVSLHVYVTDARGTVVFDSRGVAEGSDYSRWNDVYLTLRGRYGARTTRGDEQDPLSSVLYVAAPVYLGGDIAGVVSVGKPARAIQPFADQARDRLLLYGALILGVCLVIGLLFVRWLSRRLGRLKDYALAVTAGQRVEPPVFTAGDEVSELARAVSDMKQRLEGHAYVENTVQMLAHEMKSPLTGIRGAGELLAEELEEPDLRRFAGNITRESERLKSLVDRMLRLAKLEKLEQPAVSEVVPLDTLVDEWCKSRRASLESRGVALDHDASGIRVKGDPGLLQLALNNLLDNALDFTDGGQPLRLRITREGERVRIRLFNSGPRIPGYALDRVFDRFYSLPRPDTGERGSGLGLSMVREVAMLHGGDVALRNQDDGVEVILSLPAGNHTPSS